MENIELGIKVIAICSILATIINFGTLVFYIDNIRWMRNYWHTTDKLNRHIDYLENHIHDLKSKLKGEK